MSSGLPEIQRQTADKHQSRDRQQRKLPAQMIKERQQNATGQHHADAIATYLNTIPETTLCRLKVFYRDRVCGDILRRG